MKHLVEVWTAHLWLKVGVQQDVSVRINGKVVSVWTDLSRETNNHMSNGDNIFFFLSYCAFLLLFFFFGHSNIMKSRNSQTPMRREAGREHGVMIQDSARQMCHFFFFDTHTREALELTVKRGVSFLMSPRDTSIPITPRISWFWCCTRERKTR